MPDPASTPDLTCPNCRQPMQSQDLERHDQGTVRIHLCFACAGIWFDHLASAQLAPAAVIELFKEIYAHRDSKPQPVATTLTCPRCPGSLAHSFDLGKAGRFSYFRCPQGDGRFTAFFQFLREKQFVRQLTPVELQRVRAQVRQVKCSECGAPIDLETMSQCKYCHAPVSFLDPDAVQKAIKIWSDAEAQRRLGPTPEAVADALHRVQMQQAPQHAAVLGDRFFLPNSGGPSLGTELAVDLVGLGVYAIGQLLHR